MVSTNKELFGKFKKTIDRAHIADATHTNDLRGRNVKANRNSPIRTVTLPFQMSACDLNKPFKS